MYLTRHATPTGPRWAVNGRFLPAGLQMGALMALPAPTLTALLDALEPAGAPAEGDLLAPIEQDVEVWGAGVTYLRSRDARKAESATADVYQKVYEAERPEVFFKAAGWRVSGPNASIRIRRDTTWNVPEPELTLAINAHNEIIGYTVGNDVSSRDIEGQNPLYLPQAKTYNGSCALGPGIRIAGPEAMSALSIRLRIERAGAVVFQGDTSTNQMKRSFQELAEYLCRELAFPYGAFLMTGTGIVPPDDFTLQPGDVVSITIGEDTLRNPVAQ